MKTFLKNFYSPTPKTVRMFGDALLYAGGTVGVTLIATGDKTLAIIVLTISGVGKFISDWAKDREINVTITKPSDPTKP